MKQTDVQFRLGYDFRLLVSTGQIHRGPMVPSIRLDFRFHIAPCHPGVEIGGCFALVAGG